MSDGPRDAEKFFGKTMQPEVIDESTLESYREKAWRIVELPESQLTEEERALKRRAEELVGGSISVITEEWEKPKITLTTLDITKADAARILDRYAKIQLGALSEAEFRLVAKLKSFVGG